MKINKERLILHNISSKHLFEVLTISYGTSNKENNLELITQTYSTTLPNAYDKRDLNKGLQTKNSQLS